MKIIICFIGLMMVTSCGRKVNLSKDEKRLIVIHKNQKYVYENSAGIKDTIFILKGNHSSGLENWLATKYVHTVYNDSINNNSIPFEKSMITPYSFEKGKFKKEGINLSIKLIYSKLDSDKNLTLKIQPFSEEFILDNESDKEYIFTQNKDFNPQLCNTSVLNCLKKIIYTKEKGIILIEKEDTGIWRLIEEI